MAVPLALWGFDGRECGVEGHAKRLAAAGDGGWTRDSTKLALAGRSEGRRSLGFPELAASAIVADQGGAASISVRGS